MGETAGIHPASLVSLSTVPSVSALFWALGMRVFMGHTPPALARALFPARRVALARSVCTYEYTAPPAPPAGNVDIYGMVLRASENAT